MDRPQFDVADLGAPTLPETWGDEGGAEGERATLALGLERVSGAVLSAEDEEALSNVSERAVVFGQVGGVLARGMGCRT